MSLRYRLLYRLGITPWDQEHVPGELAALVEGPTAPTAGLALDIGCGTGTQSVYLAQRGWQVTGVDAVPRALAQAQQRAAAAGMSVRWLVADVGALDELGLDGGFGLLHDRGCFHDLPANVRDGYVRGVSSLAAPGATMLLMAFVPGARRLGAPSGASEEEIERRFGEHWDLISVQSDSGPDPPGPMRRVPRLWYRLRRR
ncbi:MAG TPA: methyltransferase domain-containing protein [Solirubrobacteraceae bacterium]